jgi:hypothetical protein
MIVFPELVFPESPKISYYQRTTASSPQRKSKLRTSFPPWLSTDAGIELQRMTSPSKSSELKRVTVPQTVLALPGSLDETPCFHSNSPEIVTRPGILLSTFPGEGKACPEAHLNHPLSDNISVFFHHITDANKTGTSDTLHLALLVGNASDREIRLQVLSAVSYATNPDAPFRRVGPVKTNDSGEIFAGPGDRVALDLLQARKQQGWIDSFTLNPGESRLLFGLPLPVNSLIHPLNGRTGFLNLHCDGAVYLASLAAFSKSHLFGREQLPVIGEWIEILNTHPLVEPRDKAPTKPFEPGELIYGRVAGIASGSQWRGLISSDEQTPDAGQPATDTRTNLSLTPGQTISYPISTVAGGTAGTNQIQAAAMLARYDDTAYQSNGNYGVLYDLTLPIYNNSEHDAVISITLQSPLKDWNSSESLQFYEHPPDIIVFRGTVKFEWIDDGGHHNKKLIHLVLRKGQRMNSLVQISLPSHEKQELSLSLYYPADCTPPQVLTIWAQKKGDADEISSEISVISSKVTFPSGGSDMGWLDRLFGHHDANAQAPQAAPPQATAAAAIAQAPIPPERVGLNGEYDQSGLAKRVAKAFDEAGFDDHQTVWIAQTGTTVVLKGKCHDQDLLNKMVSIARGVKGAAAVETNQVTIGK